MIAYSPFVAPPLTVDEVLKAVSGVNWRRLGKELLGENKIISVGRGIRGFGDRFSQRTNLDIIHDEHDSDEARLRAVVEEFLPKQRILRRRILDPQPRRKSASWNSVIWALYCIDEIGKAQQIRSYAEPKKGMQSLEYNQWCRQDFG